MTKRPTILALGGGGWMMEPQNPLLDDHLLALTGVERPRIALIPTGGADSADVIARFYEAFAAKARPTHLPLFRRDRPVELLLDQDAIFVSGGRRKPRNAGVRSGNERAERPRRARIQRQRAPHRTRDAGVRSAQRGPRAARSTVDTANLLAIWRVHGVDRVLQECWERGIVLSGISAGSLCWFEGGVTDSFGPHLEPLNDGLGFLPGSHCPHYDGEERRRPVYTARVADGSLPPGIAADDGAALVYHGRELAEVVTSRPNARAWRVGPGGAHEPLAVRFLGGSR